MDKGLKKSIIRLLEQCKEPQYYGVDSEDVHTVHLLQDGGYLTKRDGSIFYTSLTGREYLERLKATRKYWFKRNWFAVLVAAATIVFAGVSAGVQLTDLLTS